jgi:type VI secretion system protein ImpC
MVRDKVGSFKERADMERFLSDWIKGYVIGNPGDAGDELKARKPLAGAEVKVEEIEGNPGYYSAQFHLRPHYQLEGVNVTMSLVARLPSEKKG